MTVLQFMTNNHVLLEDSPGSNPIPVQTSETDGALTKGTTNYSKRPTHSEVWQSDSNSLCTKNVTVKVTRRRRNTTEARPRSVLTFSLRPFLFLALVLPPASQSACNRVTKLLIQFAVSGKCRLHSWSLQQFCSLAPGWQIEMANSQPTWQWGFVASTVFPSQLPKAYIYEGHTESHEQLLFASELGTADEGEYGGRWNQLLCYS